MGEVVGVEDDDLVLVVAEMTECVEESLLLIGTHESVGEEDDERTFVKLFCCEVECFRNVGAHSLPPLG